MKSEKPARGDKPIVDEVAELKSHFLMNISHEIRTPLNSVIGTTDVLLETPLDDDQLRLVEIIRDAGVSLLKLVDQVLDFSSLATRTLILNEVDFNPRQLIEERVNHLSNRAKQKRLTVQISIDPNIPSSLKGDKCRLEQVLHNLLSNSIKFTKSGKIQVEVTSLSPLEHQRSGTIGIRFAITDTGIGISSADTENLFKPFSQVDGSMKREFDGMGLGLSICKNIVEMMNGKIGVSSEEGKGSTFWFTLPFGLPQHSTLDLPSSTRDEAPARTLNQGLNQGKKPKKGARKILVVDDNSTNREVIIQQLKKLNYLAYGVSNGYKAKEAVAVDTFDLILMDCQMPGMDGFETTIGIRNYESPLSLHTPIVALTAHATGGAREQCIAAGMDDYLSKPVTMAELDQIVRRWLDQN